VRFKVICGKTSAEIRRHQKGLLAAECKWVKGPAENGNIWKKTAEETRA
jgi:hypothetical protein